VENRKSPAHPPVRERFNEPIIVFLTVCSKDRKPIFAHADSVAVVLDAWQQAKSWSIGRYVAHEQPIWQRDFWDTQLRRSENYDSKWQFVLDNPVRAGLVQRADGWPFQGEVNFLPW
jgi:hypothetical protein